MPNKHFRNIFLCTTLATSITLAPIATAQETKPQPTYTAVEIQETETIPKTYVPENQTTPTTQTNITEQNELQPTYTSAKDNQETTPTAPATTQATLPQEQTVENGTTPNASITLQTTPGTIHTTNTTHKHTPPPEGKDVENPHHETKDINTEHASNPGDTDNDGIPDEWETQGITLKNGTQIPLQHWGANPEKQDLYLQVNWMKPEWKTLGCDDPEITQTQQCQTANTKTYRPETNTFTDLVDLFSKNNINLFIDAGETYTNIPNYTTRYGGETLDYQKYYFDSTKTDSQNLIDTSNLLLGERQKVFHVCVIGDQTTPNDYSSGIGMVNGNSFFVANNSRMTTQQELRNTILHELGHNLGLRHSGPDQYTKTLAVKNRNPEYVSVMNYQYQWDVFNYSETPYTTVNNSGNTIYVPSDWESLVFDNPMKGKGNVTVGADLRPEDIELSKTASDRQQYLISKESTSPKSKIKDVQLSKNQETNMLTLILENTGIDVETFDLIIKTPSQITMDKVTVGGELEKTNERKLSYALADTKFDSSTIESTDRKGGAYTHSLRENGIPETPSAQLIPKTFLDKPQINAIPKNEIPKPDATQPNIEGKQSAKTVAIAVGVVSVVSFAVIAFFWLASLS